tara:strand:+ start:18 stop:212 length:195 start_codon:yes stop_codon:yes gene_type:complete
MLKIEVIEGNIEKALKKYKSKVIKTKLIQELRDRKHNQKPSTLKRLKIKKAIRVNDWNKKSPMA